MNNLPDGTEVSITCPECEDRPFPRIVKLIVRTNSLNGTQFLGCPNWPDCRHTQKIPESIRMRLAGQPGLFD